MDKFGFADSETVKMSEGELKKAAKAAGLPFTKLRPVLSGLLMTGFLEVEDDGKRQMYYKSPLISEPASKIDWSKLLDETKEFVRKEWPEVADEYIGRPFSGDNIELGERAKTALDVVKGDYPEVFKSAKDAKCRNYTHFLLNAEGDYSEEEDAAVKHYFQKK